MKIGDYRSSTSPNHAKQFVFKQARGLLQSNRKGLSWIRSGSFYMVDMSTGEKEINVPEHSKEGIFKDRKSIEFDDSLIEKVGLEVQAITGLSAWDFSQLTAYNAALKQGLSFYDSALSDIDHTRMGRRPPAHIMTKIDRIRNELKEKRRDIKQSILYVDILIQALKEQWSVVKIKAELSNAKYVPYKGRTKYYEMMHQLLKDY